MGSFINFAVTVRNEEESREVQEKFFVRGFRWGSHFGASYSPRPIESYGELAAISPYKDKYIAYGTVTFFRHDEEARIISADEFLMSGRQVMLIQPKEGRWT